MYEISKQIVWQAYEKVKSNKGAAGVDNTTLTDFEKDLKGNLYKIWNRMSSGSYCPSPVRAVEIAKSDGKIRTLGIPTVADRVAQMVAKIYLEPTLEKHFHEDSYGYRPNKSAHDAIGKAKERCWKYDWVIDLDIKGFFDNIDHELMMKAVLKHTDSEWLLTYIKRWLTAPMQQKDGVTVPRAQGTPQGGVISPLLANLFLHYAFDKWMERNYPHYPFERYADDIITHCKTEEEAETLKKAITQRMIDCKLELHPDKTQIAYCKDANRRKTFPQTKFDFLGYTFCQRRSITKARKVFSNFQPGISNKAAKAIRQQMREWQLHLRSGSTLEDIAVEINPKIRGWITYYGKFYKSALRPVFEILNTRLAKWAKRKYKNLRGHMLRAIHWIENIARKDSRLFVHWQNGIQSTFG